MNYLSIFFVHFSFKIIITIIIIIAIIIKNFFLLICESSFSVIRDTVYFFSPRILLALSLFLWFVLKYKNLIFVPLMMSVFSLWCLSLTLCLEIAFSTQ